MVRTKLVVVFLSAALLIVAACNKKAEPPKEIDFFSCDTADRFLSPDAATLDSGSAAAEGAACFKFVVEQPATLPLFEVKFPGEAAKFTIRFKMRVKDFLGDAYGLMAVNYASGGKQEIKNYDKALGATSDWVPMELSWTVQKGQKVDSLVLSAALSGTGTVWVDDVHVIRAPLP